MHSLYLKNKKKIIFYKKTKNKKKQLNYIMFKKQKKTKKIKYIINEKHKML